MSWLDEAPSRRSRLIVAVAFVAFVVAISALFVSLAHAYTGSPCNTNGTSCQFNLQGSTSLSGTFQHRLPDDPIVFPNQPGASHLHDIFCNATLNAYSTFSSLFASGSHQCHDFISATDERQHDFSAYWMPVLYMDGVAITPNTFFTYYRGTGKYPGEVKPYPDGLKVVAGNSHATGPQPTTLVYWKCGGTTSKLSAPPASCASGRLIAGVDFPDCWDGVNVDSADHKSHVSYSVGQVGSARRLCDTAHPVSIPKLHYNVAWSVGTATHSYSLSSGPTYTLHADFFDAWDRTQLQHIITRCLDAQIDCGFS